MSESFVDLGYRGVSLARRVKLAQVRPNGGYLELPTPMPVGSALSIATDDGVTIDVIVKAIHEQVGGSTVTPGMAVTPALSSDAVTAWWHARVTLPTEDPAPPRTVVAHAVASAPAVPTPLPTSRATAPMASIVAADTGVVGAVGVDADVAVSSPAAIPQPISAIPVTLPASVPPPPAPASPAPEPPVIPAGLPRATAAASAAQAAPVAAMLEDDHSKRTMVMDAISVEMLAEMSANDSSPKVPIVDDDGRKTEMMESVDLAALGLDPATTGRMSTISGEVDYTVEEEESEPVSVGSISGTTTLGKAPERPSSPGAPKKKRKKKT